VNARVLLVANNAYELSLFAVGKRTRLDEGRLHLYTATGWLPSDWPLELVIDPGALRVLLPRPG